MIQSPFANLPPVVKNLIIINVLCFLPSLFFSRGGVDPVAAHLGAYYFNSPSFQVWQPITYMFMHGGFWHIALNMFALFSIGPAVEQSLGSKRFLNFYFICGLGALALQMAVQAIQVHAITGGFTISQPGLEASFLRYGDQAQKLYDIYYTSIVGASGSIFGVLIAFGMMFPNVELMIIPIPIPIKAKYFVAGYIVIELFSGFGQVRGDNVAHFAHLGGALIGFLLIKLWRVQGPRNFYN